MTIKAFIVIAIAIVLIGLGAYRLFDWAKEMGYEPCALSIESAFGKALTSGEFGDQIVVSDKWRTLSEEEELLLFDKFRGRGFDCKQFPEYGNGAVFKGDSGRIKLKRGPTGIGVRIEVDNSYKRMTEPVD